MLMQERNNKSNMKDLWKLFYEFFKIGLFTIGGGLAMIPLMQKIAVDDNGWVTEEEMVDAIAVSYAVPGVVAINIATYIGKKKFGMLGAVLGTLAVTLPSFLCIVLIVLFLDQFENSRIVQGTFAGLKAAACGLIAIALYRLGRQVLKDAFAWIVAAVSFVLIIVFGVNAIWTIIGGAALGIVYMTVRGSRGRGNTDSPHIKDDKENEKEEKI